jgi:hypothetical protein
MNNSNNIIIDVNTVGKYDIGYIGSIKIILIIATVIFVLKLIHLILKSNPSKRKKILLGIIIFIIIWGTLFIVDYSRAKKQKLPLFCSKLFGMFSYLDGGTVEYIGFGYKVIDFHRLISDEEKTTKFEKIYICPWGMNIEEAFQKASQLK